LRHIRIEIGRSWINQSHDVVHKGKGCEENRQNAD